MVSLIFAGGNAKGLVLKQSELDGMPCPDTLIHGECLESMKHIADGSVDMILADLPYSVTRNRWDTLIPFEPLWEAYRRVIKTNGAIVLFGSQPFTSALVMSNLKMFRYDLTWDKGRGSDFLNANRKPLDSHEDVLVFYSKPPTYNPQHWFSKPYKRTPNGSLSGNYGNRKVAISESEDGRRAPLSVLPFPRDSNRQHPTQKPVALIEYLVNTYTNPGDLVLDNTMGSGTTPTACLNTGRHFIGIEKDDAYFEVAVNRVRARQLELASVLPL